MKLYMHPVSTACRSILMFANDYSIQLDQQVVDILTGEQGKPDFLAINPNGVVPVLEDGEFRLTESSAILKYLADSSAPSAYPVRLQARARVNEIMDWFMTGFANSFCAGLCYAQIDIPLLASFKLPDPNLQARAVAAARQRSTRLFDVLDRHVLGSDKHFLAGGAVTIADYLAAAHVSLGELIGCSFDPWPNVASWYRRLQVLPSWNAVNAPLFAFAEAIKSGDYVRL